MFKNFLFAAMLCCSVAVSAQQTGPAATVDSKDRSATTELLQTAAQLVRYGYQYKAALPLIQALEIYNRVGVQDETEAKTKATETDPMAAQGTGTKASAVSYDPKQIAADATTYAEGDKNLLALIKSVGETRGRVDGSIRHYDRVLAYDTDIYTIRFRGGEVARVTVNGDGDTDLDLYIYDENGNLITYDDDNLDLCIVNFTPRWTGNFKVKIKNRGAVYNNYVLITN